MQKAALLGLFVLGLTEAKTTAGGKCPEVEYMEDFDLSRYVGKWYTQESDATNKWVPAGTDCVTKEFGVDEDGNGDLYFRGNYTIANKWVSAGYRGSGGKLYDCETGVCQATMGWSTRRFPFKIFYTDYENFDISYSCYDKWGDNAYESLSIVSREQTMSLELYE